MALSTLIDVTITPLDVEPATIEALLDRAFGPDRRGRTAYRLREGAREIPALSFAAYDGSALAGTLQSWPVVLAQGGERVPLVLVGPIAVEPRLQDRGVGRAMLRALVAAADAGTDPHGDAMVLVGDAEYYGRFGFLARDTAAWRMPGPWEPHRLLARLTSPRLRGRSGELMRG